MFFGGGMGAGFGGPGVRFHTSGGASDPPSSGARSSHASRSAKGARARGDRG